MLISHLNMTDFVFSSPQKRIYSEFGSHEFQILKAPSPCAFFIGTGHFYRYGPSLSDGVLHIMSFGAPIVHCIGLETWFYVNITFKYDRFCVF